MQLPSAQHLNECFTYDPNTGEMFWKHRPLSHFMSQKSCSLFNSSFAGEKAGCEQRRKDGTPKGIFVHMRHNGKHTIFGVHSIVFAIMGVDVPLDLEVDHKDGNAFNNRWDNLRLATVSQNAANRRNRHGKKGSLPKGVTASANGQSFRARAGNSAIGKSVYLGTFPTVEAAHAAYCAKAQELYGEFARSN